MDKIKLEPEEYERVRRLVYTCGYLGLATGLVVGFFIGVSL